LTYNIRRQLTLFPEPADVQIIEQIRKEFNPLQFELIKAHVTLCREDEIENLEQVLSNLLLLIQTQQKIYIEFGKVARFDNGKGLFLPATNNNKQFENLRRQVLSGLSDNPGKQQAHITLMHPGNSICTDTIFELVEKINVPATLEFKQISLIEQENGGPWKILKNFELQN
jgi:hypothetical protein